MTADHHFHRHDRADHWRRIAAHLRVHPADLVIALENLSRWEKWGRTHPSPLRARLDLLPVPVEAMPRILAHFNTLTA